VLTVTHSSISCFLNCHKRYYYEYDECIKPAEEPWPFIDGSAVHLFLECYYRDFGLFKQELTENGKKVPQTGADKGFEPFQRHILTIIENFYDREGKDEETTADHHAVTKALFKGYSLIYSAEEFEDYRAEVKFEVKIPNPLLAEAYFILAGRADAQVKSNGCPYLFESKTTSDSSITRYLERLMLDSQPDTYLLGFNRMGYSAVGVIYNILRKPRHKQNSFESRERFHKRLEKAVCSDKDVPEQKRKYFFREPIYRSSRDLQVWEQELKHITKDMSAYLPYRNRSRCGDFNGCPFPKLCAGGSMAYEFRKKTQPHEELV
jgi:hypothetical protein